ncbi:MAG: hypothetical protein KDK45_14370, partial [Leptospiraceae bacterium]|nr:hypothetical protein [Leptospiraceae bacterium]
DYKATEGVFYSPEILNYLDIDRKQYRKIRYVGFGNYKQTGNSLSLKFQVYDRLEGKIIKKIKLSSQGGNFLTELAVRTAESVSRSIPIMGKVLKIKDHNVILNLGYRDGLAKDQILDITRKGKKVAEVKIKKMDEFISLAEPINVDWRKKISPKDTVEKGKPDDKQKKGGKKENSQSN